MSKQKTYTPVYLEKQVTPNERRIRVTWIPTEKAVVGSLFDGFTVREVYRSRSVLPYPPSDIRAHRAATGDSLPKVVVVED